ncbi:hypothetical protein CEUSTIGMA_g11935.t1 [Chlamydomonas eustigma]|uniref:Uncharacterized protein n=1 Tax=Chlamydomonas eustigma TaxID=1157962 RepID=A0A250XN58_9CHLO|nr:hypothetical protein CEUSTIGMA_g11935.t1 [Chlamydomonas eustigma]|eukprot:GAX84515.1 hypothetical protein CEUSTIGMA_g11935.t1 [Chlamydomonas eustigma]
MAVSTMLPDGRYLYISLRDRDRSLRTELVAPRIGLAEDGCYLECVGDDRCCEGARVRLDGAVIPPYHSVDVPAWLVSGVVTTSSEYVTGYLPMLAACVRRSFKLVGDSLDHDVPDIDVRLRVRADLERAVVDVTANGIVVDTCELVRKSGIDLTHRMTALIYNALVTSVYAYGALKTLRTDICDALGEDINSPKLVCLCCSRVASKTTGPGFSKCVRCLQAWYCEGDCLNRHRARCTTGNACLDLEIRDLLINGRINIYYMVGLYGGNPAVMKLTRKQYYTESGATSARYKTERWNRGIQTHLDALSTASTKGVSWTAHEWCLIERGRHQEALWSEYLKPRWARLRLSLYGGKKRVFANFFNRLSVRLPFPAGGRLVIAYGNAKFAPGGPGEQSVPTTRAYKECASRVATYSTDEFRTSKVHCRDDSTLQLLRGSDRRFSLRGLLYNPDLNKFVSRDLNAALNIRRCLVGPKPAILCREGVTQRLEQHIVKVLRRR